MSHPGFLRILFLIAGAWLGVAGGNAAAATPPAGAALQILEAHCVQCHGGEKTKAGLDLTTREKLLRGGESGAAVIPGEPDTSLLYRMITHQEEPGMPHKKDMLPAPDRQALADWIGAGVPYARPLQSRAPATAAAGLRPEFAIAETDRTHWAFQPIQRPAPPPVRQAGWARSPIDRFVLAGLEAKGLQPAPPASPTTLIRRVSLDLIGLPPKPEEIDAFANDPAPDAYARLVDRLLASPHYGERWGRHWLDLARFAESDGFEHDAVRPHAWRYRDYVVRSFNADKPYDRFVREQIAGDELFPHEPDALIATAFNLLGPDMVDSADQIQRRRNTLNDMTDTAALAFLGLTLGCARCHDHKFEPLAQRDYYALQAYFTPARFRPNLAVPTPAERAAYESALQGYNAQTGEIRARLAALEAPYRKTIYARKFARLSAEAQAAHAAPREQRTTEQENQIQETAALLAISPRELTNAMKKPDRERQATLLEELKPFPKPRPMPATLALQSGPPVPTHVLHRGDYLQPGEKVRAGIPAILHRRPSAPAPAPDAARQRAPLADWLVSPENPLTARVMANRIWQRHFGRGLVPTPSDFGTHGQKPTHPALLDWLASEFVARGWSLKAMHRLMLLSATYRQSSVAPESNHQGAANNPTRSAPEPPPAAASAAWRKAAALDPENKLYWRMNRLRLEGEAIRDSLLAVSGKLDLTPGGPGVFPPIPAELFAGAIGWTASPDPRDHVRRSLYIFARRNLRFPFLEVFDAPDNNLSCPSRERSTSAPQSLTLLNSGEVLAAAEHTARRLEREADSTEARLTLAYRSILGRPPSERERDLSRAFLAHSPLRELCRALFNLNAFVYVD